MSERKTLKATVGTMLGYALAFWPGLILVGFVLRPSQPILIVLAGGLSGAFVIATVKLALMEVESFRPLLCWLFPQQWITGDRADAPQRPSRRKR